MNILSYAKKSSQANFGILLMLVLLTCSACSWDSTYERPNTRKNPVNTRPIPNPQSNTNPPVIPSLNDNTQSAILRTAMGQVGSPYRYGGNNPNGFDCSGLVQYSFASSGIVVPRTTTEQLKFFTEIPRSQLQAGDLVFFRIDSRQKHVAIMLNANDFVHAPSSGKTVSTSALTNPYWNARFLKATRYY